MGEPTTEGNRWRARPVMAAAIAVAVFAAPVLCSIGAAVLLAHLWAPTALRWLCILAAATIVFIACERFTGRMAPLTMLLKLGLVFPGRAPRRLSLAMRLRATRDLDGRIDEARFQGVSAEPTKTAEQIAVLITTLFVRDAETRRHASHVGAFTDLIAERLRLSEDDRDRLRWTALFHDVGRMTVDNVFLDNPGAQSDDQWEMMRRHPLDGVKLTAPLVTWLGGWANTIAEHHERFDGGGYPLGLAGEQISMGGRIVAVADSYDDLTSLRRDHRRLSTKAARLQLAAYAGVQFDPIVVRAFLAVPVSRLHAIAPLTWVGSLPFGKVGRRLTQVGDVVGRVGVSAMAATACVVGLVAVQRAGSSTNATHQLATQRGVPRLSPGTATRPPSPAGARGYGRPPQAGVAGPSTPAARPGVGIGTSSLVGKTDIEHAGSGGAAGRPGRGQPSGGGTDGSTGSTTVVAPGSTPSIPTTTLGGTFPIGSTTTSTDPPPPPIVAPSGLRATSDCRIDILLPEISLSWTASPTPSVTGYVIVRGPNVKSLSYAGTAIGRTSTSYTDLSVIALNTTYWYEVTSIAGGSFATSDPISVTTPALCITVGNPD